jgi:lysophospholipase L1-like esterase
VVSRLVVRSFVAVGVVALVGCGSAGSTEPRAELDSGAIPVEGAPGELAADGQTARDASGIDSVVMIGDSITRGSIDALRTEFESLGFDNVAIEAENGKRMVASSVGNAGGSSVAEFLAASGGDTDHAHEVWVVALGTNDIGQYAGADEIAAAVNEVIDAVPDDAALVWVDTYFRDRPEQTQLVNSIVRDRVSRRGDSVVAPWTAFATQEGVLSRDGVHPTTDGADVFAFVVADTVREFLGR